MLTSDVLNRAADLIEERGWVKGKGWFLGEDHTAGLCLEGGIMAALGITVGAREEGLAEVWACPAHEAVSNYLDLDAHLMPYNWNDRPERTQHEVIEVLRAAAVVEAAKETASTPALVTVAV